MALAAREYPIRVRCGAARVVPTEAAMEQRAVTEDDWDDKEKLAAFRAAVQAGADDIAAGRYRSFHSADELSRFLREEADKILGRNPA